MGVRDRLKWWFFREELSALATMKREMKASVSQLIENDAATAQTLTWISAFISEVRAEVAKLQGTTAAIGVVAVEAAATREIVDRILLLLEPQAQKLHARRPVVQDWDAVLRENLAEQEE